MKNAALSPGTRLGSYKIEALLGAGGMGEVYLASDTRLDRPVALKLLPADVASDQDRVRRFIGEAKAASALNHPNVATIYDIGESDGVSFIAMEYVAGQTLAVKIAGRPMDPAEIVEMARQVADALEAAHAKGITHRDIKPANLMLTPRGQVKVLDFGLAKTSRFESPDASGDVTYASGTIPGVIVGTVAFMSPEQAIGRSVDHRSDLFSLGVVLYQMATGRLPFSGSTALETIDFIRHAQPDAIARFTSSVPAELERIIHKCLEKEVERRYQSAHDLLVDLRNLQRDTDAKSTRATAGEARRHNLPEQLTSFVGRSQEMAEVRRLLSSARLLTLTGAGGCGKTRLALQVAADLLDQFADGVWVVDLAPLSEPDLVTPIVASVLDVREGPGRSLSDALADYFRHRHLLLVLDNCEHLIAVCAQLAETLLRAAPKLHILATSREGLSIPGETVWRVPSLSLPNPSEPLSLEALIDFEAVRLFVDRATAVEPAFAMTTASAAAVAEVCRRLDGIPLAIELAAARVRVLPVEQISARLNDRFRLLTGGSRTAVARQRTLEATVDWSYDLLSATERRLLCRLSVFPGGWTLEAAEEVCAGDGIEREDALDLLSHLVDKSLVIVEDDSAVDRRYRFLETVRQYGRERLLRSDDAERVRARHLTFFFELARRAEPELQRANQVSWLNRLQHEHDNLRSALEWSLAAREHGDKSLELAATLFWFWVKRGYFSEGRQWLERALAAKSRSSPALRAKALIGLSLITQFQGDWPSTLAQLEESLALGREAGDLWAVAMSLLMQAGVALLNGNLDRSATLVAEGQPVARASGHPWLQGMFLEMFAFLAQEEGNYDRASRLYEDALALLGPTGDKWIIGQVFGDLALLRLLQEQYAQARAVAVEAILMHMELGDLRGIAWCLESLAAVQAAQGEAVRAGRLWGAADALLDGVGSSLPPFFKMIRDRYLDRLRESLGERAFQAALSEGRAMSLKQIIQYALEEKS